MSTTSTTRALQTTTAPTSTHLSWSEASQRAQSRIADLANRRATEARTATSSLSDIFTHKNSDKRSTSFRVGQLDTELLDAELLELLRGQVWNGLKYFNVGFPVNYGI